MKPDRVLLHAADRIERNGWWNGSNQGAEQGNDDIITAVLAETHGGGLSAVRALDALRQHLETHDLAIWNDAQTDATAVTSAMRACAAALTEHLVIA